MARIGISITKSTPFRNSVQEFSNVYYYEMLSLPNQSEAEAIIDNLVTLEKTFHSSAVTFVRGRCWSQVGTPSANEMIAQKNLSGTGSQAAGAGLDKERAYLFRLRAGNDSRGNPVYLRKWYHSCGLFDASVSLANSLLENTAGFTTGQRTTMQDKMDNIGDANGSSGAPKLCAKGGRLPTVGQTWVAHQFLEHHQMGDMWRAQ